MDLLSRLWQGTGRTTAIASRTGSKNLKIFLDDRSFHCLKRSIPPGSPSKLILGGAVRFKNLRAWFGTNSVVSCNETEARNLLLYASHCPGAVASINDALRSAGLVVNDSKKGDYMERILFLLFIVYSLFVASSMLAAAESQTWKIRPGDNLDIIATTLEIPKEEIKSHNPGVLENNLQIGQKLKLPLRSYVESKTLEEEVGKKDERIGKLESKTSDLEKKIASAESQLRWQPIWLWGFWICFSIVAFIASGAYWIFRQTHPRVFEQPHDRSIRDFRESQIRVRSSFSHGEEGASSRGGQWQPSLKRLPAHR